MARILVVDDDRTQRLVASQALKSAGHEVIEATDGGQALEMVRTQHPELIVCDVVMPGMNGYQFVTALRQEDGISGIPVIMLTSMAERAHMRVGMNAGADDYLGKPFSFDELNEAVAALLNKRRSLQEGLINSMNDSFVTALEEQRESIAAQYEQQLLKAISDQWDANAAADAEIRYEHAVILKAQIVPSLRQHVTSSSQSNALVRKAYEAARDALHLFNATHLLAAGNDLVALFTDDPDSVRVRANVRSVRSALALQKAMMTLQASSARPGAEPVPVPVPPTVALHCGPVTVLQMSDPLHGGPPSTLATGATMIELDAICEAARHSQWPIAASAAFVGEMAGKLVTGASTQAPCGDEQVDVIELHSLR